MNRKHLAAVAALAAMGCATQTDMQTDSALTSADRATAARVSELVGARCTTYQYDPFTEQKTSGDRKVFGSVAVKRMYRSESGWIKAETVANSVWDNVYLHERNNTLVCGEKHWQAAPNTNRIAFVEIGKQPSRSTAAIGSPPKASAMVRPFALKWEGIDQLVSGTAEFADDGKTGSLAAVLPGGAGATCTGIYEFTRPGSGHWAISCTNGASATGIFTAFGAGKGSAGRGKDSKGGLVEFTVGGQPIGR